MAEFIHVVCPSCGAVNRLPTARAAQKPNCGTCHKPLFPGKPAAADAGSFDRHLSRGDIPVVADFWAPWCGPCLAMAPAYERAAAELEPRYRFLKVSTEEEPALAARYNSRSIPTMILFVGGRPVAQTAGAMDMRGIVSWVESRRPAT